ncbi:hypothetical protein [Amycolatopsis silviterrae]|uniref:DUF4175 domain-containing protein n=1 Tax=Amycolatopsis silviterrae TaxID=1656914 RepID=A0ABW5GZX6_9PSEU
MPAPRVSLPILVTAWSVPALVLGQFALISGIPLAALLISSLRNSQPPALRWWSAGLTAVYLGVLALWLSNPESAPSLSKSMNPAVTAVFVASGVVVAIAHHVRKSPKVR